eukprot:6188014-Pleurochrysis_carterae.AAC.2
MSWHEERPCSTALNPPLGTEPKASATSMKMHKANKRDSFMFLCLPGLGHPASTHDQRLLRAKHNITK